MTWHFVLSDANGFSQRSCRQTKHLEGILVRGEEEPGTASVEWLNSVFSAAKRKARGYRSTDDRVTMLYFVAGKVLLAALRSTLTAAHPRPGDIHGSALQNLCFMDVADGVPRRSACRYRRCAVVEHRHLRSELKEMLHL